MTNTSNKEKITKSDLGCLIAAVGFLTFFPLGGGKLITYLDSLTRHPYNEQKYFINPSRLQEIDYSDGILYKGEGNGK